MRSSPSTASSAKPDIGATIFSCTPDSKNVSESEQENNPIALTRAAKIYFFFIFNRLIFEPCKPRPTGLQAESFTKFYFISFHKNYFNEINSPLPIHLLSEAFLEDTSHNNLSLVCHLRQAHNYSGL